MKHIHTEGPGSILKSRFVRGVFPLVAALLAFALAAPEARAAVTCYEYMTITGTADTQGSGVYVNTGYKPNGETIVRAKFASASSSSSNNNQFLFCSRKNYDNNKTEMLHFSFAPNVGGKFRFDYYGTQYPASASFTENEPYEIEVKGGKATVTKVSDSTTTNLGPSSAATFSATYPLVLFQSYAMSGTSPGGWGNAFRGTFYYLQVFEIENGEEVLKHHFVPCTEDGTVKICDLADSDRTYALTKTSNGDANVTGAPELTFNRPVLGAVTLVRTNAATYSLSATEDANAADLAWIANNGSTATTNGWVTVAEGGTANWTISDLATNTTYEISALATNENGTAEATAGTLYTGMLMFDASSASDAYEYGSVTGGVVVARATGDPFPLTVNYTISGSAGTEGTTWAAPVAVTIPANATSAVLPVVPLMDGDVTSDVTITVSLAAGNYELPASNAATLTLVNLAAPVGKKTWVATANGNASDGANWSPSGAPTATDEILFDDNFSNARCIWDAAATHTVAAWEQASSFTGVVELQTTYESGAFAALAITGNCTINGGTMTQTANSNAQTYRLSLTVGGDLSVASGAQITATGKGYSSGNFPAGSACGVHGGSVNNLSNVYGDLKHPVDIGSGGASANMTGGGAVHILVTGDATVDGTVASQPSQGSSGNAHGAGGSIYLQAASLGGNGEITAAGYGSGGWTLRPDGAGGRVAVVLTSATTLDFPVAQLRCNGTTAGYTRSSGGGTIFVKTALQQNGTLYVVNNFDNFVSATYWPTKRGVTPIPAGQTWTLDEIHFRGTGVLCVPEGTTLNVPLSGISASSERTAGILYEGGTIDFGTAPYALSGNWVFQADQPYTFDGDVTVSGGASLGCLRFSGSILDGSDQNGAKRDDYAVCDVVVDGNLTIAADGYASGDLGGPCGNAGTGGLGDGNDFYPRHGGQYATHSGNRCYGSVFDPVLPGQFGQVGDHATISPGGGAIKLTVTGDLVVNGKVQANGERRDGNAAAAAGSINIRARTLSGSGTIKAYGLAAANIPWAKRAQGAGGRIAVRVTGEEVGTTGVWTSFTVVGCTTNTTTNVYWNRNTSAGTIYLQGKSDGEKGGTIYVRNQKNYDTSDVATWIPAAERGDSAADFANAKLVIADRGVVAIGAAKVKFAELTIEDNSRLDLNGKYVRVKRATVGGTRLRAGRYTAATLSQFLADSDSGKGGVLDVGGGLSIIVR